MTKYPDHEIHRGLYEIEFLFPILSVTQAFICGGYARYCMSPVKDPVKAGDLDIYCKTIEDYDRVNTFMGECAAYSVLHDTERAISYKSENEIGPIIQVIKPITEGLVITEGTTEEILNNFDFTVAKAAMFITSTEDGLKWKGIAHGLFDVDETKKKLRIENIHCPVGTTFRVLKYINKGYRISKLEMTKLFLDWDRRDQQYRQSIASMANDLLGRDSDISNTDLNMFYNLIGGVD